MSTGDLRYALAPGGNASVKILMAHNYYQQRGGEAEVFEAEQRLLAGAGHQVVAFTRHSEEIQAYGPAGRARLALDTFWSRTTYRDVAELIAREAPDVAHFTNTFPLISPSAYDACRAAGVAVVQSLHNYRLLCPAATLWRDGAACEECLDHSLERGVRHACYRNSRPATAVLAGMLAFHRRRGTWAERVDRYVALSEFARAKFVAGGMPPDRIAVKPNFVEPDPDTGAQAPSRDPTAAGYALFAGRLAREKGVHTLLDAWRRLSQPVSLRIAGDGPLRDELARRIEREDLREVELLGALPRDRLLDTLRGARLLVFPSEWYEGMPMAILEAFACRVPVLASRLGSMQEMIEDERTGLLFAPGDARDLADRVAWACCHREEVAALADAARGVYEARYTAAANLPRLLAIYREAIEQRLNAGA